MGSIRKDRKEPLEGKQTLIPYFTGSGEDSTPLYGTELEIMFMVNAGAEKGFRLPTDAENIKLTDAVLPPQDRQDNENKGFKAKINMSNEPGAHMVELKTNPHVLSAIENIAHEIASQKSVLSLKATELETPQIQSPFAIMPFATPLECMNNIISGREYDYGYCDRPRIMMESFKRIMSRKAHSYPVANTSVHGTHGVKSLRHAFEMTRLQSALLPFFLILTENRPPYQNAREQRVSIHTGLQSRQNLCTITKNSHTKRGLIPDFTFAARNEHDFLNMMLDEILHAPMLVYYDHEYNFKAVPRGQEIAPANMQGLGPETVAQFELAMSEFWWSFKYKLPPEGCDGILHELRDFDSSPETTANMALIIGMLALNDSARAAMIDRLEKKYALPLISDPLAAEQAIKKNLLGVYHRGDKRFHHTDQHMKIPFGAKNHTMLDFLRQDLLPMLEQQYQGTAAADKLEDLRFKAQNGMTNTQLWYDVFKSMTDQIAKVQAMTADPEPYNTLANQQKSWAMHREEGRLPCLKTG